MEEKMRLDLDKEFQAKRKTEHMGAEGSGCFWARLDEASSSDVERRGSLSTTQRGESEREG